VGRIVRAIYERQLDGAVRTLDEAKEEARRMVSQGDGAAESVRGAERDDR
jgi:lipocalin